MIDDWGWADVGFHKPDGTNESVTPNMDALVASGIMLNNYYVHKYCSPSRSSYQSGRFPYHVNVLNLDMDVANPADPVSGFAGVPRNMTGIAEKLKSAGYATHMVGKWDAGMATPDHTPKGRGYDSSLIYFHHANDYWTSIDGTACPTSASGKKTISVTDLWATDGPAKGLNNSWDCSQSNQPASCKYEDEIFVEEVLARIAAHDPTQPFFLFWAPHIAHEPLQVPQAYLDKFSWIDTRPRQFYMAMVNYVDTLLGRVVDALKAKNMWDDLLWLSSADNGGPIYASGSAGANNWPKRGGKMSNWQGGIQVNAYASGGLLPAAVQGTVSMGLMAGCDVYATFCSLAGVDATDAKAKAANLPPVDGLDMWPFLSGQVATSPRTEVPVGSTAGEAGMAKRNASETVVQALVTADGWKLLVGQTGQNIWTGPYYPNASSSWKDVPYDCGIPGAPPPKGKAASGCLFNYLTDPTEHADVAESNPDVVAKMYARLQELQKSAFSPDRGTVQAAACDAALKQWGGFWGPFMQ